MSLAATEIGAQPARGQGGGYAILLPLAVLAACAPSWWWCVAAWRDPAYSGTGLWIMAAVLAGGAYCRMRATTRQFRAPWMLFCGVLLLLHGVCFGSVPRLGSAVFAAAALAAAWLAIADEQDRFGRWGVVALILLALPLGNGVDFYIGFPLRLLVTNASAWLLGSGVVAQGTALSNGVDTVFVDAPCAGLRMLTTALTLAAATAAVGCGSLLQTTAILFLGGLLAVLGNIARAIALYGVETTPRWSGISHETVGLAIFAACVVAQVACASWLIPQARRSTIGRPNPLRPIPRRLMLAGVVLIFGLAVSGTTHLKAAWAATPPPAKNTATTWPTAWGTRPLVPRAMDPAMQAFLSDFPGHMAEFALEGGRESVLLRQVRGVTRKLHPSELCFRGFGWTCTPRAAYRDVDGHLWSCFEARHTDGQCYLVRQRYVALPSDTLPEQLDDVLHDAPSWPDAGAWFWAAAMPGAKIEHTLAITHLLTLE